MSPWMIDDIEQEQEPEQRQEQFIELPLPTPEPAPAPETVGPSPERGVRILDISPASPNVIAI